MKILDKTISLSTLASSATNGLGHIQPLSCTVTEELNGIYEAEFQVLTTDKYYSTLKDNGLVKIPVGDGSEQMFRIYSISEPINFVVTCKAQHITYDLAKVTVTPFTATGAVNTKNQMLNHILGTYPFDMWTDISNTTSTFKLTMPRSFRECLGGYEGSLLDVFRGEYEYDNLTVKMWARRGADNGVRIAYGKNLTDFTQEQNIQNVYDGVYGYAIVDEVTYEASSIYNMTGATTPKIKNVDFSNKYEQGDVPTGAELLAYATSYATNNHINVPKVNIKVGFIPLWQTDEYKDILPLERVKLGDTVHVYFDKLGVEASSRVIKTVWNALTEKYDSIELGDARSNLTTVINETVVDTIDNMDIEVDVGWLDEKIDTMTTLIANGLGLHISRDSIGRIILHNEDTIANSQYQYMITSSGFMLSDDYGQTWNSGWDISGNAVTNSLSTITLKALEIYGSYIEGSQILFGDSNDKYILAQVYNDGNNDVGVTFDGTGYVRFQPQEQFIVDNLNASNNLMNEFVLGSSGTYEQAFVTLKNYDHNNQLLANSIDMDDNFGHSNVNYRYNRMELHNYSTKSGTQYSANVIELLADRNNTNNYIYLTNLRYHNTGNANQVTLSSSASLHTLKMANYDSTGTYGANEEEMTVSSTYSMITLTNKQATSNGRANMFQLYNNATQNAITLRNYDIDNPSNTASEFTFTKTTDYNYILLNVYRSSTLITQLNLQRTSSANAYAYLGTKSAVINNKTYYEASIEFTSDDGIVRIRGQQLYFNGTKLA